MTKIKYLSYIKWFEDLVRKQIKSLNEHGISNEKIVKKLKGKTSLDFHNFKSLDDI